MNRPLKKKLLTVRIDSDTLADFNSVAVLRGATMSGLLHQFIVKAIREEKERNPEIFTKGTKMPTVVARLQKANDRQKKHRKPA